MRLLIKGAVRLPWFLDKAVYTGKSLSVASQDTGPTGVYFKSDGTKVYISGFSTDSVYQYSLSTAWDISTGAFLASFSLTHLVNPVARDIAFKLDGTKFYIADSGVSAIYQYSLSTAWDISTASYDSVSFSTSVSNPLGLAFGNSGAKMYYCSSDNSGEVLQFSLSSAWDISSATYDSVSLSTTGQATVPLGILFDGSGKLLLVANNNGMIYQYRLSTAWDISTASYRGVSLNTSAQDSVSQGATFNNDGSFMYVVGSTGDKIYQYSL